MEQTGNNLFDRSMAVRPTRHRLGVAMGLATVLVALLLFVLGAMVSFGPSTHDSKSVPDTVLSVLLRQHEAEPNSELPTMDESRLPDSPEGEAATETAAVPHEAPSSAPSDFPVVEAPHVDWVAEITEAVSELENNYQEREETRMSMWRQTRSVMFQPTNEFVPDEQQPVIADLRFRPEIHVIGLGVTVGSCFIGLPLVGVPVEKRTVGIRLLVCADDPG